MNNDSQLEENKWALKLTTILFNVLCSVDMSIRHSFFHQYHLRNGSESFRKLRWSSPNRITQLLKSVEGGQIKPPLCLRGEDSWFTCTWSHHMNDIHSAFIIKLLIQWISYLIRDRFLCRRKSINKTKADPGHFDREIENNFRPSYSVLPCSKASDCGIRWCEVRFLMGTPNVFFVPRSWQDEKHLFLFPYRAQNLPSLIFYLQIMIMYWKAINTIGI